MNSLVLRIELQPATRTENMTDGEQPYEKYGGPKPVNITVYYLLLDLVQLCEKLLTAASKGLL